jgi:hypothetical protein
MLVQKNLAVCYRTYFRVVIPLEPFPCLNSYSFLSFHACKVYVYRNPSRNANLPQLHLTPRAVSRLLLGRFGPDFGVVIVMTPRRQLVYNSSELGGVQDLRFLPTFQQFVQLSFQILIGFSLFPNSQVSFVIFKVSKFTSFGVSIC